jgi:hypothetical protein
LVCVTVQATSVSCPGPVYQQYILNNVLADVYTVWSFRGGLRKKEPVKDTVWSKRAGEWFPGWNGNPGFGKAEGLCILEFTLKKI